MTCGVLVWLASSYSLYGAISVSSTGQSLPLLAGKVTKISIGAIVTFFGSTLKPENFDFKVMKQKIVIVDARIGRVVERESDAEYLKRWSKPRYKIAIGFTLVLVIAWPVPVIISGYIFSLQMYAAWVGVAVDWAAAAATVIVLLLLLESRSGMVKVLKSIGKRSSREPLVSDAYYSDDPPVIEKNPSTS